MFQKPVLGLATGLGKIFRQSQIKRRCTLIVAWYAEQEEPWVILTDLPPGEAGASWYALRFWIEAGFKAVKSLGWQWDKTRRTDPARVSRHSLVLSVATLLALAYGTRVEDAFDRRMAPGNLRAPPQCLAHAPEQLGQAGTDRQRSPVRHRLADQVAAPGPAVEPGVAAARTVAGTQA